jgi:hypothetical protein
MSEKTFLGPVLEKGLDRMAAAGAKDSLPQGGMYNSDQLDQMYEQRLPSYRRLAEIMLRAFFEGMPK